MQALNRPFTKIIAGTSQFVIPVFQRDYTWNEEQCEQLWKDILHIAEAKGDKGHFLGSVVYVATGDSSAGFTRWLLIDGQQRVTTLTLMLAALRDYITEAKWNDPEGDVTAKRIDAYYLKNNEEDGERTHKLVLRRRDQATLASLVHKQERPSEVSERILEAYEYFLDKLSSVDPATVYRGFGRLIVVDVTLDRQKDDPQLVFESLNSTGVDLSQSDLIRNFILMRLPEGEQTRLYEQFWSKIEILFQGSEKIFDSFARDFLALLTQASKQEKSDNIYRAFRSYFPTLLETYGDLEKTLEELKRYAGYYARFMTGRGAPEILNRPMAHVRHQGEVPAILVMRLYHCFDHVGSLSEKQFVESLRLIESYLFRRTICGEQTRGYWQVFSSLAYGVDEQNPLDSLKVSLALQRESARFPDNKEFQRNLIEGDLYPMRGCHYMLDRFENSNNKEPTDTSKYSIEHILPQNERLRKEWRDMLGDNWKEIQEEHLNRLGNLTLTGYNSTYQDRPFHEKKSIPGGFEESSVRLNKFVREQDSWTGSEITKRGKSLTRKALKIWGALEVEPSIVRSEKERRMRDLAKRRDVSQVRMSDTAQSLFDALSKEVAALDESIVEMAENKSVSYHAPEFFLEVLPRKHRLTLVVAIDFNEVEDTNEVAQDASERVFFAHAQYEGGVMINLREPEDIEVAMPIVRQAYQLASS